MTTVAATSPRRRRWNRDGLRALVLLTPGGAGLAIFVVAPLVASLVVSFYDWGLLTGAHFVGLANYRKLFGADANFFPVLRNTFVFAFVYTPLNLICATLLSTWINSGVYGRKIFRVLFLLPVITPAVANAEIWRFMLDSDGLINEVIRALGGHGKSWLQDPTWAMVWIIFLTLWQSIGYNIIVLGAGLDAIPHELYEAAAIDGAGRVRTFFSVTLPMLSPALFFASTMTLISAFQVFAQPQLMTNGGPGEATNTMVLYLYQSGFSFSRLGYASAIGWVLFVIIMLATALQFVGQRKWVHYA